MKKNKFNLKLTAFLVSLFLSLLLVILGGKNKYCLAFGFIMMGISLELFILYSNEKMQIELSQINEDIDEVDVSEEIEEEEQELEVYEENTDIEVTKEEVVSMEEAEELENMKVEDENEESANA